MSTTATLFLASVWSVVIGFTGFCFYKLMKSTTRLDGE